MAAASAPVSANDVLAELGGALAYTTVMTTLARLETKGVLTRALLGRAYVYSLAGDPEQVEASMAAHRMRRVLDSRGDRAGVLARFVAISPKTTRPPFVSCWPPTLGKTRRDRSAGRAHPGKPRASPHRASLGRLLPPATAVRLLTVTALVTALSTGFVLSVAAFVALAQLPRSHHWAAGRPVPSLPASRCRCCCSVPRAGQPASPLWARRCAGSSSPAWIWPPPRRPVDASAQAHKAWSSSTMTPPTPTRCRG